MRALNWVFASTGDDGRWAGGHPRAVRLVQRVRGL